MSVHDSHDLFRHTPLRYLGYANEVGEAFRYQMPFKYLVLAYVISGSYVLGDTIDKSYKSYLKHNHHLTTKDLAKSTGLTLIWQILATEAIPGYFVYRVVKSAKKYEYSFIKNTRLRYWMPTIIGLSFIPLFPHTIDPLVDYIFDKLNLDLDLH